MTTLRLITINNSAHYCRAKKQQRAVLEVLPFVGFLASGRKCPAITIKLECVECKDMSLLSAPSLSNYKAKLLSLYRLKRYLAEAEEVV